VRWTVIIPAKTLPAAKSRLVDASVDAAAHARLVEAIRADTLSAVAAVPQIARVVVVRDRAVPDEPAAPGAPERHVLTQRRPGLNAALGEAALHARHAWPADGVAALVADLPALRADELQAALVAAAAHSRAHVPDADGTGTTMLTAGPGVTLEPAFGVGSAQRHATTSTALDGGPGLRRDVDTAADLHAAVELGVGPSTSAALAAARSAADTVRSTSPGMMHDMSDACGPEV
jgi:2-phospho-L-lactate/phosphoenolpyruvate guanylyltransferase